MTLRFLADENIDPDLVLGLKRRVDDIDIARVQEVGLRGVDDPVILQWAADEGRALITKDVKTIPPCAHDRVRAGQPMAGVFVLPSTVSIATAIDELALIAAVSKADEWTDRVVYLPVR